jgi:uncharacterized membrane protein YtjA (UPF0391 family)
MWTNPISIGDKEGRLGINGLWRALAGIAKIAVFFTLIGSIYSLLH